MTNEVAATTARLPARLRMTPGRRLTLVLGVPVLLAFIGWTAFSAVDQLGSGSFPVSYTFPAGNGQVIAHLESGNITLRQAEGSTATLTGTAHYSLFRATFSHSGNVVRYHCPLLLGNCELNGTLEVPADSPVSLSTDGGDVIIPSFTRNLALDTGGGNLTAGTLTDGGTLTTGGGDVTVSSLAGPLNLNLDGGNLNVQAMTSPTATITSGGGDVSLTYTKVPDNITINSDGGNVTLTLPRNGGYNFRTNPDGGNVNIDKSLPSGSSTISVDSGGGDITITAAS